MPLRETLENKNYTVKTLNLLADNRIPDDAKAVIIAGPMQPLSPAEVGLLNKYAQQGGALIIIAAITAGRREERQPRRHGDADD